MASLTQSVPALTPEEAAERQRAVRSAVGSLRIEGMELEPGELEILERHVRGEIDLDTMHAEMDAYIEADL
jgi:antitoxin VbhA-like protein